MSYRTGLFLIGMTGAAVLAYQFGSRLSEQAVTTLAGVMCGVLASVPIGLGLVAAFLRERSHARYGGGDYDAQEIIEGEGRVVESPYSVYAPPYVPPAVPPVSSALTPYSPYVAYAPPPPVYPTAPYYPYPPPTMGADAPSHHERHFRVIGEDEGE